MITLDALRLAALSEQPWAELDRLVRAELSAGRLTRAIYDEIMSLEEAVSNTPGYTEDAHDAIGDTLDALIGFCRADCAYKNPPVLPSAEEIAKLPRWAQVAFAARAVRRVLPLFQPDFPPLKLAEHAHNVYHAVEAAEQAAAISAVTPSLVQPGYTALELNQTPSQSGLVAAAADYIDEAARQIHLPDLTRLATAAVWVSANTNTANIHYFRRDFDHLASLAEWQKWDDDTPVPPEVFGPLWPEGPPQGWPPVADAPGRAGVVIEAFARERPSEAVIEDEVVNLFNALNRYHIARSGVRLTLDQFRSLLPALVAAEV